MGPEESVFQFQQIQKKEMIYFVLGLSISVSINKKTEKKMIFIFFLKLWITKHYSLL